MAKKSTPVNKPGLQTFKGKSRTQQNMAAEADINNIVRRYLPTGALPTHGRPAMYGDFTSIDYMSMLNAVSDMDNTFRQLPSRIRGQFRNDPYQLLRFIEKPENHKEAVRLGLLVDPSRPFGANPDQHDDATGLAEDQTDLMSQADIMAALDSDSTQYDPTVLADLNQAIAQGDEEAKALLEAHRVAMAARKARNAEGSRTAGPLKKRPPKPS